MPSRRGLVLHIIARGILTVSTSWEETSIFRFPSSLTASMQRCSRWMATPTSLLLPPATAPSIWTRSTSTSPRRPVERQTNRQTDRQTDRDTHTHTHTQLLRWWLWNDEKIWSYHLTICIIWTVLANAHNVHIYSSQGQAPRVLPLMFCECLVFVSV